MAKTTDIEVYKINEVYVRIICEQDCINSEISDFFTFITPGFQYTPAGKKGWNGKISLYNKRTRYLYAGLVRYLITFAAQHKYSIAFDADVSLMNPFSLEEAAQFIDTLKVCSKTVALPPRDYQIVGVAKAIRYKRALLVSPTASGKSYMMYCIIRYLLQNGKSKGLIIVPTTNLVEQMTTDFIDYAGLDNNGWNVTKNVHKVYQGQEKYTTKPVIISTWQSLFTMPEDYFEMFDFVIGDEAHLHKAKSIKYILTSMINAEYRIAMTGTLDGWKINRLIIEGLFGSYTKLTTTKRMIDEKQSADIQIKCLILKHPSHISTVISKFKKSAYRKEIDYIVGCVARNNFIKNLAVSLNGNTLILFQFKNKQGEIIFKMIEDIIGEEKDRKIYYITGDTETEVREEVRSIIEKESNAIIVASYGVYSTGINIRNIHNIIFASPSKGKIRVSQSIGRGLRKKDNEGVLTLYDIVDDMRLDEGFINYGMQHFAKRFQIYRDEQFKVSNYNIDLKY